MALVLQDQINPSPSNFAGKSVALSSTGNTLAIGAPVYNSDAGQVWVYTRSGSIWSVEDELTVTGIGNSYFGISVDLSSDGNTLVSGASYDDSNTGAAWAFTRTGSTWNPTQTKLLGTGTSTGDKFGVSVGISADGYTVVVGSDRYNSSTGAIWVFTRSGLLSWNAPIKLEGTGSALNDRVGTTLGLSDNGYYLAAGGKNAAWVFTRTGLSSWDPTSIKLTPGGTTNDVAISNNGNTVALGLATGVGNDYYGDVVVFTKSGTWDSGTVITPTEDNYEVYFGKSVAISGDANTLVVGGYAYNSNEGATWVFTNSGSWTQSQLLVDPTADRQGWDVALSTVGGTTIASGAPSTGSTGAAVIFFEAGPDPPIPCFVENTLIEKKDGEKKIQDLTNLDYIINKFSDHIRIDKVFCSEVPADFTDMVIITKDSIRVECPMRDIICTKYHRFEVDGKQVEAGELVNGTTILEYRLNSRSKIYHILLEGGKWMWMRLSGMLAESLDPRMGNKDCKYFQQKVLAP